MRRAVEGARPERRAAVLRAVRRWILPPYCQFLNYFIQVFCLLSPNCCPYCLPLIYCYAYIRNWLFCPSSVPHGACHRTACPRHCERESRQLPAASSQLARSSLCHRSNFELQAQDSAVGSRRISATEFASSRPMLEAPPVRRRPLAHPRCEQSSHYTTLSALVIANPCLVSCCTLVSNAFTASQSPKLEASHLSQARVAHPARRI